MASKKALKIFSILKHAFLEFKANDPLRMAGATAFFTTFALPAVLIILIQSFGLILTPKFMSRQLLQGLADLVGTSTATELHKTLINVRKLSRNWYIAIGGFIFLIFVATTLFTVIRDSLNQLWKIKMKDAGIAISLLNRAKSFAAILLAGVLFMAVLLGEGLLDFLKHYFPGQFEDGLLLDGFLKQIISTIVVSIWFAILFKFLPDGRPSWKTTYAGALFTGILFTCGKLILQWLLTYSNMQTIYGASTSSVLILLFVFYSSFIFYYGACFTKAWAEYHEKAIEPKKHAVKVGLAN
ncbi:MAG: YihY/virulence factor BrkB family protein [Bacteroidetes bacterium]|nr:YihY/virulence factor BrkB family protein [Bacteroidota bacterium]